MPFAGHIKDVLDREAGALRSLIATTEANIRGAEDSLARERVWLGQYRAQLAEVEAAMMGDAQ